MKLPKRMSKLVLPKGAETFWEEGVKVKNTSFDNIYIPFGDQLYLN